jgi:hypothetical protein
MEKYSNEVKLPTEKTEIVTASRQTTYICEEYGKNRKRAYLDDLCKPKDIAASRNLAVIQQTSDKL